MNRNKDIDEQLFKKAIKMQIDKIEVPKNEKLKNWEKIQGELTLSNSKLRTSKKRFVVAGLIASFLIFIVTIYVSNSDSTAFFWNKQKTIIKSGSTTQIMTGTQTQHLDIDDFVRDIDDSVVFYDLERKVFTIEQAKEIANFDIIIPAYIPNNFEFQYVVAFVLETLYETNEVRLHYESADINRPLKIRQQYYGEAFGHTMVVDHEDTKIEHLTIDNKSITLFTFKDDSLILWLELPHMLVTIDGFIDRDEIFQIAQSMIEH
ncbi:DUF4367 domain-containing protein [Desulfuribacillus alkaliarsenatis]|uniref:DUF4367 domain-containing protein n=1 Tax=Desulfuribacillus alkaliarsenatis TaxID=766136 RepID=A0A1E5FZV7_9FIRM|nr:DUF4367 domain-containing protein [Desulfuribacillus alkaliarsenatis]OEF96125.1 hypothetical protein BHF68_10360 [Desulfuribacillus alkaliarsenatis]